MAAEIVVLIGGQAAIILAVDHGGRRHHAPGERREPRAAGAALTEPEPRIRVASLDDVIRSKQAAGRPKDLAALPLLRELQDRLGEMGR